MTQEVVMTPSRQGDMTIINIEKVFKKNLDESKVVHKAGGHNTGLIINKQVNQVEAVEDHPHHLQLEFRCFLVDQKTGKHIPEARSLKFWFDNSSEYLERVNTAYDFFTNLVNNQHFPRDYVGFIKRVMKSLQEERYSRITRIQVEMRYLRPEENATVSIGNEDSKEDKRPRHMVAQDDMLLCLETAFPNCLNIDSLCAMTKWDRNLIASQLKLLLDKKLIKEIEAGKYVRNVLDNKSELRIVKNMAEQLDSCKPTIAIITSKYYEKIAVDSMMERKTSFVKFKTEGDSNVYTIGWIGPHKVVSTKLPMIGHKREAQISSGNTTTRLLGTFGEVDHVVLVGVCGGVPHFADYFKHVRLGDVIVSAPHDYNGGAAEGPCFIHCDHVTQKEESAMSSCCSSNSINTCLNNTLKNINLDDHNFSIETNVVKKVEGFTVKRHSPIDHTLLKLAWQVVHCEEPLWLQYFKEAQDQLKEQQVKFSKPSPETDRLFMTLGGGDLIEVNHPSKPDGGNDEDTPTIRFGPLGSGAEVVKSEQLKISFASQYHCVAFDTEMEQVLDSVEGSRKDSYLLLRGVSDYRDGGSNNEWMSHSSLLVAALLKQIIQALPVSS